MDGDGRMDCIKQLRQEKVNVENEAKPTDHISELLRMYDKLSGMTGPQTPSERTLNLDVCVVPTNRPIARLDEDDVTKTQGEKYRAVLDDIEERHAKATDFGGYSFR